MEDATHEVKAYNPMCGDKYVIYLKILDDKVMDASFTGFGCAISRASTSILTKKIIGLEKVELSILIKLFFEIIDSKSEDQAENLTTDKELLVFAAAREFPERKKCASLGWDELEQWILK
jgi:nitrogen fixation NifU-like protein